MKLDRAELTHSLLTRINVFKKHHFAGKASGLGRPHLALQKMFKKALRLDRLAPAGWRTGEPRE